MSERRPHQDEVEHAFEGVDKDVLYDLRMADLLEVQDWGKIVVTDNTRMFAFILRRTHPHIGHPDD